MFTKQVVPVAFAFEGELFSVVADMIKARKREGRALPVRRTTNLITIIAITALDASTNSFDNKWSAAKALETDGGDDEAPRATTNMHDSFTGCSYSIDVYANTGKWFKSEKSCGDNLKAIFSGTVYLAQIDNHLRFGLKYGFVQIFWGESKMQQLW